MYGQNKKDSQIQIRGILFVVLCTKAFLLKEVEIAENRVSSLSI